jgi:transposase-like protein
MVHESLHLRAIKKLLRSAQDLELSDGAVRRLKWFLFAAEHDGNVSITCRHFDIARSTFRRWSERFSAHDITTLEENSRKPRNVRSSTIDPRVIEIVRVLREDAPKMQKAVIVDKLLREHGIVLSAATVGRIITRHKLFFGTTKSHREKRASVILDHKTQPASTKTISSLSLANDEEDFEDPYSFLLPCGLTS